MAGARRSAISDKVMNRCHSVEIGSSMMLGVENFEESLSYGAPQVGCMNKRRGKEEDSQP